MAVVSFEKEVLLFAAMGAVQIATVSLLLQPEIRVDSTIAPV